MNKPIRWKKTFTALRNWLIGPRWQTVLIETFRTLVAILIAYLVAFLIIGAVSEDPENAIRWFVLGPLSSSSERGEVFKNAMPLMFAGIGACLIIRGGHFNMFTEGAFYVGGLVAALSSIYLNLPPILSILVPLLVAIAITMILGFIPAKLKTSYRVNEFVSSIMFNFIVLWVGVWLISNVVIDVSSGDNATRPIPDLSRLPLLIQDTNVTVGVLIAGAVVLLTHLFLNRTRWGFSVRMSGDNPHFARHIGLNVSQPGTYSQVIGIGIAGLGGGVEILSNYRRFNWKTLPGYGFDGFMVAIMAKNKPLMIPLTALFIGYLRSGADLMAFNSDVAQEVVQIIQGLILILVASEAFFSSIWLRNLVGSRGFRKNRKEPGANF